MYEVSRMTDDDEEDRSLDKNRERTRRNSKVYSFSDAHLYKYQVAKRSGTLRFPDLFQYHIKRSTADVQREARLLKKRQSMEYTSNSESVSYSTESSLNEMELDLDLELNKHHNISNTSKAVLHSISIQPTTKEDDEFVVSAQSYSFAWYSRAVGTSIAVLVLMVLLWKVAGIF